MRRVVGSLAVATVVLAATVVLWAPAAKAASTVAQQLPAASEGRLPSGPVPAPSGAGIPAPLVILAGFAVLFVLVAAVTGAVRFLGWDPTWAAAWRHAWHEAEYRLGGGWLAMSEHFQRQKPARHPSREQPRA
jgi:hypothetical protein